MEELVDVSHTDPCTQIHRNFTNPMGTGIQYEDMAYTSSLGFATVGANNVRRLSRRKFVQREQS